MTPDLKTMSVTGDHPRRSTDAAEGAAVLRGAVPGAANAFVRDWVEQCVQLCQPSRVVWCDGSKAERDALFEQGVRDGVFTRLNQQKLPGCYLHRSNPNDVA